MERVARALRWLTGLSLGVGLLVLVNQLNIPFFLYYPRTTHTILLSDSLDLYLFLISSVCVLGTIIFYSRKLARSALLGLLAIWVIGLVLIIAYQSSGVVILYLTVVYAAVINVMKTDLVPHRSVMAEILVCSLSILVLIEFAASSYWLVSAVNPQTKFGSSFEELELNLTYSIFPATMFLVVALLSSWFWVPVVTRFLGLGKGSSSSDHEYESRLNLRFVAAALDLVAILAILVFFYPYVGGQTWIVGVDSYLRYLKPLSDLAGLSLSQAFFATYRHGLYVLLLYVVEVATGMSSAGVVKFAPLMLAFITGLAVFWAILRAGWGFQLAILSSICSLLWLPTTLGVYAGIQANWAAFALWMFFLSFLFMRRAWNGIVFVLQCLIPLAIFLVHPWTWGVFFANLVLTAIISRRSIWKRRCRQAISAALSITLTMGILAFLFIPAFTSDLTQTISLYASSSISPARLLSFGNALGEVLSSWASFLSPILVLISLVGAYSLTGRVGLARNYLLAWIATWCLGSILVAPIGYNPTSPGVSESELWRMFYVSPLPLLLAMGMGRCLEFSKRFEAPGGIERVSRKQPIILTGILVAFTAGILICENMLVTILLVLGASVVLALILIRFPRLPVARMLITMFLMLVIANATYRSLYPLLLDPHNLLG